MANPEAREAPAAGVAWAALGGALAVIAVALPPEIDAWSRAACQMVVVGAALLLLARPRGARWLPNWSVAFVPLAAAAVLVAACRQRAVDEAADAAVLIAAVLAGRRIGCDERARRAVAFVIVALGAAAGVEGALQHHVTYPSRAEDLGAVGAPSSAVVLGVLRSGRPSGPFILPAALGGFLALALPLSVACAWRAASPGARAAAAAAALAQLYALALTRSLGAVVSLAAAVLLAIPVFGRRRRRFVACLVVVGAVVAASYFLWARRLDAAAAEGADPLSLRLGNWGAAARMVADHPFFGTGPGSFGTWYPRYMRQGMNETRYAHNSYLQAAAGWGVWILWPMAALCITTVRKAWRAARAPEPILIACFVGAMSFLVHNLGDFTAYLPGVAIPASLLLGLALGEPDRPFGMPPGVASGQEALARGPARLRAAALLLMAVSCGGLYAWHAIALARSRACSQAALVASDRGDLLEALSLARRAAALRPSDPDPPAFLAQLLLDRLRDSPEGMSEGRRAAVRAVELDPESAILHYTLALYHQAAGESAASYLQVYAAHRLYPLKPLYRLEPMKGESGDR